MQLHIVNGPNLNLLGRRETSIYGDKSFEQFFEEMKEMFPQAALKYYQSNSEGELVSYLQEVGFSSQGIVLNAGAYTHTSVALADAVAAIPAAVVEVHISQVFAREKFRHHSYLSPVCRGTITGLGIKGYALAVQWLLSQ
jgi:3-dehydroquinate dehydratase-2